MAQGAVTSLSQPGLIECRQCWLWSTPQGSGQRVLGAQTPTMSGISPKVTPRTTEIKVSLPSALPHSEPALLHRLGLTGRCGCAAGTRTRLSVPAQAQRGVKTEDSEAAEVLWGTAGLWHLWPVAGPSQHIPQLCPSLPSWATAVTPADL